MVAGLLPGDEPGLLAVVAGLLPGDEPGLLAVVAAAGDEPGAGRGRWPVLSLLDFPHNCAILVLSIVPVLVRL